MLENSAISPGLMAAREDRSAGRSNDIDYLDATRRFDTVLTFLALRWSLSVSQHEKTGQTLLIDGPPTRADASEGESPNPCKGISV